MPRRSAEKEFFCSLAVLCNNPSVAENSSVLYLKVYQIQGLSVKAQRRTFSLSLFVTINASARAAVCVKSLKNASYARLAHAYAGRIVTLIFVVYIYRLLRLFGLTLIGDKWKVLILRDLMPGTKRFGELKKSVGNVSQKVLTAQLRAMEESGLVHREVYAEVPPRVEYSLTELGKSLRPVLDSMQAWGEGYKASIQ